MIFMDNLGPNRSHDIKKKTLLEAAKEKKMLVNLLLATKDVKIVVAMAPRNLRVLNLAHNTKVFTNNFECQLAN